PDVVEIILVSSDPRSGANLAASARRFANQASQDRWQLASRSVRLARDDFNVAVASGLDGLPNDQLLNLAERTLADSEGLLRSGETDRWFRMARRADAWASRAQWMLTESLMPDWPNPTSSPPAGLGALSIQAVWRPLMSDRGWGDNRMTAGGLDSPHLIGQGRWTLGRRLEERAESQVTITRRGAFSGSGALRATVTPLTNGGLPGGYAGTAIQISSPGIEVQAGRAVRIDAMMRTIGFGQPHQGVLVYDTIGGQAMGVLIRGRSDWTPVRLYRQTLVDGDVRVMFELIGGGEVLIDNVQLSLWEPEQAAEPIARPIRSASDMGPPTESETELR
ncbi:MAG: hypothetical protein AAF989_12840, partial [Planctomycetota bacterium]